MDTEKTLSEIARSVLVSSPESDQKTLREKAGVLALLNLLGIVLSFYGDSQGAQSSMGLLSSLALAPGAPSVEKPKEPDLLSSIISLAGKLLGGTQGQGGIDPSLIGTLMGSLSALSTARAMSPRPQVSTADTAISPAGSRGPAGQGDSSDGSAESEAPGQRTSESDADSPEEGTPIEDGGQGGERQTAVEASPPQKAAPPPGQSPQQSPLQQILGIDPRIITLALNVLADLMKAKNAAQSERSSSYEGKLASGPRPGAGDAEVTVTPDGKTVVIPKARKQPRERLYHKPGLGIYRKRTEEALK